MIALINEHDQYHHQALASVDLYDQYYLVVTDAVLLEIANALARNYKIQGIQVIEDLISSKNVEVVSLTPELFDRGFNLYKNRQDKAWGLVDCISFVVMQDKNINLALTFDKHFIQAGFQLFSSLNSS
ncbi:MAG: PIN domain-containing protein [Snowella sp.]|nr:PIN domain-containing protein [Snowella sp.]